MVSEWQTWLEDETAKLRASLLDAERWLARWELDAVFVEDIERAEALYAIHLKAWQTHCELCEWFSGWSRTILLQSVAEVKDFGLLR